MEIKDRAQVIDIMRRKHTEGYNYVVRDEDGEWLLLFTLKPKKYRDLESWGYVNQNAPGVKMAYPIKNKDIEEINWKNRSPVLISDFLAKNK
ncbi:DNA topoisomerase [Enterococcus devriesei]|uniref:DNA topoisomerase n=1 Tax=Enterococcus devriesei TaxID=319970 RepID=UPI0028EECA5B|nr:DNA topoisomerase [Enterococcus devriesei]